MSTQSNDTLMNLSKERYLHEIQLLGSLLVDPRKMDNVMDIINETDFEIYAHSMMWRAMKYLYDNNQKLNTGSLVALLNQFKKLDDVGGSEYISEIYASVPTAESIDLYASMVKS